MKQSNFTQAVEYLNKSLLENRVAPTLTALKKAEKMKEEAEKKADWDPQKSQERKEKGNQYFKDGKYPEAVEEYTEAIRRSPTDPILYSNRAAAYLKLAAYPTAMKDCDEAVKLDPKFLKAFIRKGHCHFFLKEYQQAMKAYDQASLLDESNEVKNTELEDSIKRTIQAMNQTQQSRSEDERLEDMMKNPEVQSILQDPIMRQILNDMQTNPGAAQEHLRNPLIAQKIQKLADVGFIKMGNRGY